MTRFERILLTIAVIVGVLLIISDPHASDRQSYKACVSEDGKTWVDC